MLTVSSYFSNPLSVAVVAIMGPVILKVKVLSMYLTMSVDGSSPSMVTFLVMVRPPSGR